MARRQIIDHGIGRARRAFALLFIAASCLAGDAAWALGDNGSNGSNGSNGGQGCDDSTDTQAVAALRARIQAENLYAAWTQEQCLAYILESCDTEKTDVVLRESHTAQCGGDPNTSPVVDRFRVHKHPDMIEWFDLAHGQYRAFSDIHSIGGR